MALRLPGKANDPDGNAGRPIPLGEWRADADQLTILTIREKPAEHIRTTAYR